MVHRGPVGQFKSWHPNGCFIFHQVSLFLSYIQLFPLISILECFVCPSIHQFLLHWPTFANVYRIQYIYWYRVPLGWYFSQLSLWILWMYAYHYSYPDKLQTVVAWIPRSTRSGHWFASYWYWFHTSEYRSVEECDTSFTPFSGLFTLHVGYQHFLTLHYMGVSLSVSTPCTLTTLLTHFLCYCLGIVALFITSLHGSVMKCSYFLWCQKV